ncbi:MAG: hypothetical protein KF855_04560 [Acidobacteria bacterium]|nr:hypothetical protein [Acidobacteriota bacterium]
MVDEQEECPQLSRLDIALLVDDGLSEAEAEAARLHIAECRICTDEARLQRMLFQAIGNSLEDGPVIEPPADFTAKVVRAAESQVTGVRSRRELLAASAICLAVLAAAAFAAAASGSAEYGLGSFVRPVIAVSHVVVQFIFGMALSLTVIVRSTTSSIPLSAGVWAIVIGLAPVIFYLGRRLFRTVQAGEFGK